MQNIFLLVIFLCVILPRQEIRRIAEFRFVLLTSLKVSLPGFWCPVGGGALAAGVIPKRFLVALHKAHPSAQHPPEGFESKVSLGGWGVEELLSSLPSCCCAQVCVCLCWMMSSEADTKYKFSRCRFNPARNVVYVHSWKRNVNLKLNKYVLGNVFLSNGCKCLYFFTACCWKQKGNEGFAFVCCVLLPLLLKWMNFNETYGK